MYKEAVLKAFPVALRSDVEAVLNIIPFDDSGANLISENFTIVQLSNEQLTIPYRIYFNEPDIEKEDKLTDNQKTILHCLYLRHHDGYLRQRHLEKLVKKNDYWVIPFTLQLLGEYILEILQVLNNHINSDTLSNYERFVRENPKYWQQTESRMISYWNEYYRTQNLQEYIGWQIVNRINSTRSR